MALKIDSKITPARLRQKVDRLFELSAWKILSLDQTWDPARGAPVFTRAGRYVARGWTEWTQGFQIGSALLQFDATGEERFWDLGWEQTRRKMASHLSHTGVHDHGFNNISTYGQALRLFREGRRGPASSEIDFCELALKISGAVQAARWTRLPEESGFIYSFNGPHSLFIDTLRSLRSLAVAHQLGQVLRTEGDRAVILLERLIQHALLTARFAVFYGEERDAYDVPGRVAHESIFNINDGQYRCPNSQQGYSPFSTWMRGLSWAICGFAEQLEFLATQPARAFETTGGKPNVLAALERAGRVTAEFYLENCCRDGIPYWDTAAPQLYRLGNCLEADADPFNSWEPVDSSAAAIAAQGLLRLGHHLSNQRNAGSGRRYHQAGLTIAGTLFDEPYLSTNSRHQGLILHSVYHRPNGWDHIPRGAKIPQGESSQWGDYHARELALMIQREAEGAPYPVFHGVEPGRRT